MNADVPSSPPAITCTVQADRSGNSISLSGQVVAHATVSGHYRFEITKASRAGTSRVNQGGAFEIAAGQERMVGSATLDYLPDTNFSARLVIDVDGRSYACQSHEETL